MWTTVPTKVLYIDCVDAKCKNLQKINSVEIFYYINTSNYVAINYKFHGVDFEIWKQIVKIHRKSDPTAILCDIDNFIVNEDNVRNANIYYTFELISESFKLYKNINFILYLQNERAGDNLEKSLKINVWNN